MRNSHLPLAVGQEGDVDELDDSIQRMGNSIRMQLNTRDGCREDASWHDPWGSSSSPELRPWGSQT